MSHRAPFDEAAIARIEAALLRCGWRRMTVDAVAWCLVELLEGEVADPDDGRVWMVGSVLSACRWRSLTAAGVARQAIAAVEAWHASCRRLEAELASLLD
jgi:hypothetical protein